jgi:hypothetical protein
MKTLTKISPPSSSYNEKCFPRKVVEKIKTHFIFNNSPLPPPTPENRAVYEVMWEKKYCKASQAAWRVRFACWITTATDTHSECVILIAFPRQQWLRERVSMLRYT